MIPGIQPSGTNTEQIIDVIASAEKLSGVCRGFLVAAADGNGGRAAVWRIGGGGALSAATPAKAGFITGADALAGTVMIFWQVGQLILAPL
jgi:hypothetical protein